MTLGIHPEWESSANAPKAPEPKREIAAELPAKPPRTDNVVLAFAELQHRLNHNKLK